MRVLQPTNVVILLGMISQLFITNKILADTALNDNNQKKSSNTNKNAIELSIGKFHPGPYAPYQMSKKKWNSCNTLNICDLNSLFGKNVGFTFIKRYYVRNNHKIDIDSSITFNSQKYYSKNKNFLMLSIVPTYRYFSKNFEERINIGIGAGLNLAISDVPSESHDSERLNTQLNLEVAYQINKSNRSDMVIGIKHRCSLFGIIGGKLRGSQWYTIGLRQWL